MMNKKFTNKLIRIFLVSVIVISFVPFVSFSQQVVRVSPEDMPKLDQKTKSAIVDSISKALNDVYIFADVAKKMENQIRKNLKKGSYNEINDLFGFTQKLTEDLQSISHDKHLNVRAVPPNRIREQQTLSPEELEKRQVKNLQDQNFGFKKVEILPGNIGYIDFRFFANAKYGGPTAIAAMNFLAYTDAIIFDLRQNGGGNPSMIQLITSYLFKDPVHLNSFYIRKGDSTEQYWTQACVPGPKMVDTPIFVLTSNYTFSGAEEFTYNLKNIKRGIIIGETTGGGAHPVNFVTFDNLNVGISLPYGRAINPITGTNWEGTGIEPHIKISADQALIVARMEATKLLMEKEKDEVKKNQLAWALKGLEIEKSPVTLSEGDLQAYVGDYGPRKIMLENGSLFYQREDRPKYKLIPMGNDWFMVKDLDYFRIQFEKESSGKVIKIIGHYDNGNSDSHNRN